jgi:hypothetical protein
VSHPSAPRTGGSVPRSERPGPTPPDAGLVDDDRAVSPSIMIGLLFAAAALLGGILALTVLVA